MNKERTLKFTILPIKDTFGSAYKKEREKEEKAKKKLVQKLEKKASKSGKSFDDLLAVEEEKIQKKKEAN